MELDEIRSGWAGGVENAERHRDEIRVYIGNPISGEMGQGATHEYLQRNCLIAQHYVEKIKLAFPNVYFFPPAAYDNIVERLLLKKYVTYDQIMQCDHEEQEQCHCAIFLSWEPSGGVEKEIRFSESLKQPHKIITEWNDQYTLDDIEEFLCMVENDYRKRSR